MCFNIIHYSFLLKWLGRIIIYAAELYPVCMKLLFGHFRDFITYRLYAYIYRPTLHNKLCNWYSEYTHAKSNNERELIGLWSKVLSLLAMIYIAKWFCSNDRIYLLEQYPREWLKNEDLLQILPCQVGLQWKAKVCEFWWTRMSYWPRTP